MANNVRLNIIIDLVIITIIFSMSFYTSLKICLSIKKISKINYQSIFISKRAFLLKYNLYFINNIFFISSIVMLVMSYINNKNVVLYYICFSIYFVFVIYILITVIFINTKEQNLFFIITENKLIFINTIIDIEKIIEIRFDKNHRSAIIIVEGSDNLNIKYNPNLIIELEEKYNIKTNMIS